MTQGLHNIFLHIIHGKNLLVMVMLYTFMMFCGDGWGACQTGQYDPGTNIPSSCIRRDFYSGYNCTGTLNVRQSSCPSMVYIGGQYYSGYYDLKRNSCYSPASGSYNGQNYNSQWEYQPRYTIRCSTQAEIDSILNPTPPDNKAEVEAQLAQEKQDCDGLGGNSNKLVLQSRTNADGSKHYFIAGFCDMCGKKADGTFSSPIVEEGFKAFRDGCCSVGKGKQRDEFCINTPMDVYGDGISSLNKDCGAQESLITSKGTQIVGCEDGIGNDGAGDDEESSSSTAESSSSSDITDTTGMGTDMEYDYRDSLHKLLQLDTAMLRNDTLMRQSLDFIAGKAVTADSLLEVIANKPRDTTIVNVAGDTTIVNVAAPNVNVHPADVNVNVEATDVEGVVNAANGTTAAVNSLSSDIKNQQRTNDSLLKEINSALQGVGSDSGTIAAVNGLSNDIKNQQQTNDSLLNELNSTLQGMGTDSGAQAFRDTAKGFFDKVLELFGYGDTIKVDSSGTAGYGDSLSKWQGRVDSLGMDGEGMIGDCDTTGGKKCDNGIIGEGGIGKARAGVEGALNEFGDSLKHGSGGIKDSIDSWGNSFKGDRISGNGSNSCPTILTKTFPVSFGSMASVEIGPLGKYLCEPIVGGATLWTLARAMIRAIVALGCMWWLYRTAMGLGGGSSEED